MHNKSKRGLFSCPFFSAALYYLVSNPLSTLYKPLATLYQAFSILCDKKDKKFDVICNLFDFIKKKPFTISLNVGHGMAIVAYLD